MQEITTRNNDNDRNAIVELINNYGYHADRREADKQAGLYLEDGSMEVYNSEASEKNKPVQILKGRRELANAFGTLKQYDLTYHFNGQCTIHLSGDSATGIIYCIAHHFFMEKGKRMLLTMGIHYYDIYSYKDGHWFFANRKLIIDWQDKRESAEK